MKFIALFLTLFTITIAYDDIPHDQQYYESLMRDETAMLNLFGCILEKNPCDDLSQHAKSHMMESLTDGCNECDTTQKHYARFLEEAFNNEKYKTLAARPRFASVVDCVVSNWGEWSQCDTTCGSGSMVRSRRVVLAAAHGGRHCPSLVQRRACQAHHGCTADSDVPLREESAMILPVVLSVSRHSNETVDIRKNFRLRNPDDPESNAHREYCVQFLVTKVSKGCHTDSEYKSLREGNQVCVMCETAALRRDLQWRCSGHGVAGHSTRFYALVAPHCHGKWERSRVNPDKTSGPCTNPDFIFV